jgi:hypothetical protein
MKLAQFFVIAVLAGTLGVLGCDDETSTGGSGGSGTAGTGGGGTGGGGTGGGGTGGGGGGIDLGCDEGNCTPDSEAKMDCETLTAACIADEIANEEECIAAGNLIFCGGDGAGGNGGNGGSGGAPDPGEVCDEGACAEPGDVQDQCKTVLEACLIAEPEENWDECVIGVQLIICKI